MTWRPIPNFTAPRYLDNSMGQNQKCVNWYPEKTPDGYVLSSLSGNFLVATAPNASPCRGAAISSFSNSVFSVNADVVYDMSINGQYLSPYTGSLSTTTGDVVIAEGHNGKFVLVDGQYGYVIDVFSNTVTKITDSNFPAYPISVTCFNGQFIVIASSSDRWYMSKVDNGLTWTPVISGRAINNPDELKHVISIRDMNVLFGSKSIEFWYPSDSDPYLQPITGSTSPYGITSIHSVAVMGDFVYFHGCSNGRFSFYRMNGATPENITPPFIQDIVGDWTVFTGNYVYGVTYSNEGQDFYEVHYSPGGNNSSWIYNITTGAWFESDPNRKFRVVKNTSVGKVLAFGRNGSTYFLGSTSYLWNKTGSADMTRVLDFKVDGGMGRIFNYGLRFDLDIKHDTENSYTLSATLQKSDDGGLTFDMGITLSKAVTNGTSAQSVTLRSPPLGSTKDGRIYRLTLTGPAARIILRRAEGLVRVGRF